MNFRVLFRKMPFLRSFLFLKGSAHERASLYMKSKIHSCFFLVLTIAFSVIGCTQKTDPVLSFNDHKIYEDEFLLYCDIAKRNLTDRNDTDAVYQSATEFAVETYALYDLAVQMGLSDPFSISDLEQNLQKENQARKELAQTGQPVMGVLEFELTDYLEYSLAECRYNIALALAKSPTDEIITDAKQYYEENKQDYISDATYKYQVVSVANGEAVSEIKTISYEELTASYHSSDALGDVLLQGDIGQEYDVGTEKITVLDRTVEYFPFSDVQQMVIMTFVEKKQLSEYVQEYMDTCKVVFDASQLSE